MARREQTSFSNTDERRDVIKCNRIAIYEDCFTTVMYFCSRKSENELLYFFKARNIFVNKYPVGARVCYIIFNVSTNSSFTNVVHMTKRKTDSGNREFRFLIWKFMIKMYL